jgi:uncharacterized membrane protein
MRKTTLIALGLILLSLAAGLLLFPRLPDRIASHWDMRGEADGYSSKMFIFFLPALSAIILGFFLLIPKIDPLGKNIEGFRKYYDLIILSFIGFMSYLFFLTMLWNTGYIFNMSQMLAPAFGVLFYCLGIVVGNTKKNWFIGIRTPWTLSSDIVWYKTHKIGGKLFKAAGVVAFLGALLPAYALFFIIVPVIAVALYTVVYSYVEFVKQRRS